VTRGEILEAPALEALLAREPSLRRGLVLANGLFDLIHVGHIRYLEAARAAGDRLVVALNSDASAFRLKGPGRPLQPLEERLEIVAAFACVTWATWFEEERVDSLLRKLRPAIHAKGTDYTVESVPEREVARELGIETVIVGDPKRHASSALIERVGGAGSSSKEAGARGASSR
jgi:D-glycero-beta-D-manno-heptose 1-phosphate adenylyltransferase